MALSLLAALEQPLADRPIAVESEQELVDRMFDEIIRANFPDAYLSLRVAIVVLPPWGSSWEPIGVTGSKGLRSLRRRFTGYWRPTERSPPSRGVHAA